MSPSTYTPIQHIERFVFGDTYVSFRSSLSLEESIAALANKVSPIILPSSQNAEAVGIVSKTEVAIKRHAPMVINAFKPVFYGTFEGKEDGIYLTGCFTVTLLTKLIVLVWLVIMAFLTILTSAAAIAHVIEFYPTGFTALWLPFGMLTMFSLGAGMALLCKWLVRHDVKIISHFIIKTLSPP